MVLVFQIALPFGQHRVIELLAGRALHRAVYGDSRTKYGAVRVSAVPYYDRVCEIRACDGTVTAADGRVPALYGHIFYSRHFVIR
jgi:hypothetical protein